MNAEMDRMVAWLNWSRNPCGKPPLKLAELQRFTERPTDFKGLQVKGIDLSVPKQPRGRARSPILSILESACHADTHMPVPFAYFEGPHPSGMGWIIEVYARGKPFRKLPEPPKPVFIG